jgi:hypothetical protein
MKTKKRLLLFASLMLLGNVLFAQPASQRPTKMIFKRSDKITVIDSAGGVGCEKNTRIDSFAKHYFPPPTVTITGAGTNTVTSSGVGTSTPSYTVTSAPTPTVTITGAGTNTVTSSGIGTSTPSYTVTSAPTPTVTVTGAGTNTVTSSGIGTSTPSYTVTSAPTPTVTITGAGTNTVTSSGIGTSTPSYTVTSAPTPTVTITGDITGIGTNTIVATLANTAVTAGTYTLTTLTVDAKGRITNVTNGVVLTNANLTGAITSVGNSTSLGSFTSANLSTALTDETGTGADVFATSPTLVTPLLGTPTSGDLSNCINFDISKLIGRATTLPSYVDIRNSLGRMVWGVEGSVGGTLATGTTAWASVYGSGAGYTNPVQWITNGIVAATITTTQAIQTANTLQIGTHLIGGSAAPTGAVGSGAGSSPSAVTFLNATDLAGQIILTMGSSTSSASILFTITFAIAYSTAPTVILTPANGVAVESNQTIYVGTTSTTNFVVYSFSSAPTASVQYKWNYQVIQ